jgi:signal transduction histidine kinase
MRRLFDCIARRTSYCFAFVPFVAASGYFAACYAFFIVYLSVERFEPITLKAFVTTVGAMLVLLTVLHALGFGALEPWGIAAKLELPRSINRAFRRFQEGERPASSDLEDLLERLARFPGFHMGMAAVLAAGVTVPAAGVEFAFSRSFRHLAGATSGGIIAGVLYCYFCYVITEALSSSLRRSCRKDLSRRRAAIPLAYGISLRGKVGFAVAIAFFSMVMLVYFLWFCRATLLLTAGFLVVTFLTLVVLVSLYFRSVKSAFEEILRTAESVSRGGGDLLHLGNNEKELVTFAEHFNVSVRETIALRRDLEGQVAARTRDLTAKALELERANERLQQLDRLKSGFLSSVSHELRTPLTAMLGFARIVGRDFRRSIAPEIPAQGRSRLKAKRIEANLEIIQQEGERLTRLINDVLDLARIESGRMEWNDEEIQVGPCVEQAIRLMDGAPEHRRGVSLLAAVDEPLPAVRADSDRVVQVLVNLLGNALKFTEAGEVRVHARPDGRAGVLFTVEDTGPGIRDRDRERLFERFHQGGSGRQRPPGTGLGLAICREIVEHYGGRIRAEPRRGPGSRFLFSLPGIAPSDAPKGDPNKRRAL